MSMPTSIGGSFERILFVAQQRETEQSIQELVKSVLENPEQLTVILENLLKRQDAPDACIDFLDWLMKEKDTHAFAVSAFASEVVCHFPPAIAVRLLEKFPLIFVGLIESLDLRESRRMLRYLTQKVDNWKTHFQTIFESLDKSTISQNHSPQDVQAGRFLRNILDSLPCRRYKQWTKFCVIHLSEENWAFFILALNKEERKLALNTFFCSYRLELTQNELLPFCEVLAQQVNYPNHIKVVLNKFLDKFYLQKKFHVILNQFNRLSLGAQVCFLDAMSTRKQRKIFYEYRHDLPLMAAWMDCLFHYRHNFDQRKQTIQLICENLEKKQFIHLLSILQLQGSNLASYFLICLSKEHFDEFIFFVPFRLRSQLLANALADSTKLKLLRAIKASNQAVIFDTMSIDMENPDVPVDPSHPLTLKNCLEILEQMKNSKEIACTYSSFIKRIPPVLVGVLALEPENRETLLELAHHLTEEQLKFFITPFFLKKIGPAIERMWPLLSPSQFFALLEGLSSKQFARYFQFKTMQLQQCYLEFLCQFKILQKTLECIKEMGIATTVSYASEELQAQVSHLYTLIRRVSALDYQYLSKFLQQPQFVKALSEENLTTFQQTIQNLNSKRMLFEGKQAVITHQLNELEKLVNHDKDEEDDLTMILYTGFWTLVREGTLPYLGISPHSPLGITHAGQLNLLGIKTNQDLCYLGISPEKQKYVESLVKGLEELLKSFSSDSSEMQTDHDDRRAFQEAKQKFQELWQNFLDIRLEEKFLRSFCKQIVQFLDFDSQDSHRVKKVCLELSKQIVMLEHVSLEDRENLSKKIKELEECQIPVTVLNFSFILLEESLLVLRGQYPLCCLQRYLLMNVNLKQTWEECHSLGCHSISSLIEKGYVKHADDLLRLEEIIKKVLEAKKNLSY